MRRTISLILFFSLLIIACFLLMPGMEEKLVAFLGTHQSKFYYAAASFAVLASDIVLPVPSSVVMILNGKILGVVAGTALSFASGMTASMIGFFIGRKASKLLAKLFSPAQQKASDQLMERFGLYAIALSKAIPVLSEAVSISAGTTGLPFKKFLVYSAIGHFGISIIYAWVGAVSANINSNLVAGITILSVLLLAWILKYAITAMNPKPKLR